MTKDFPAKFTKYCNAIITGVWCNIGVGDRHISRVHWILYTDSGRKIESRTIDSFRRVFIRCRNLRVQITNIVMRITIYDNHYGITFDNDTDVTTFFIPEVYRNDV